MCRDSHCSHTKSLLYKANEPTLDSLKVGVIVDNLFNMIADCCDWLIMKWTSFFCLCSHEVLCNGITVVLDMRRSKWDNVKPVLKGLQVSSDLVRCLCIRTETLNETNASCDVSIIASFEAIESACDIFLFFQMYVGLSVPTRSLK